MTADAPPARSVALIAPMRNEAGHVEDFIDDVAAEDFDGPLELLVADGASSDGSSDLLRRAARRAQVPLRLLENPKRYVPDGLKRTQIPARAPATSSCSARHPFASHIPPTTCVSALKASNATGAANVGGILAPTGRTRLQERARCGPDGRACSAGNRPCPLPGRIVVLRFHTDNGAVRRVSSRRVDRGGVLRRAFRTQPGRRAQPPVAAGRPKRGARAATYVSRTSHGANPGFSGSTSTTVAGRSR